MECINWEQNSICEFCNGNNKKCANYETAKTVNNELYNLIKGMEKIKEINDFISYVCI